MNPVVAFPDVGITVIDVVVITSAGAMELSGEAVLVGCDLCIEAVSPAPL